MTESLVNSVVIVILTALTSFVVALYFYHRTNVAASALRIAEATAIQAERIAELEKQLAVIRAAVVPISVAFQAVLIKELTHYHTPELDALLQKVGPPSSLTEAEARRMTLLLKQRTIDMADEISDSERDAAAMLPLVMKRAHLEAMVSPLSGPNPLPEALVFVSLPAGRDR